MRDFVPVAAINYSDLVMVIHPSVPAKSVPEFIAYAKANPGKVYFASAGNGTGTHVFGELFKMMAGVEMVHVPYRGGGPALNDLVAGQIDLIVDQTSNSIGQVRAGNIRAYAVTAEKRLPSAPEIPTTDEAGLPGFHMTLWSGMWVPRGTPGS